MAENAPFNVEVTRGEMIESRHRVLACVRGGVHLDAGDTGKLIYPRSAIKPLQATVLIESGAATAFGVTDAELALASASHSGEERHVATVRAWLARIGLSDADLECGVHAVAGVARPTAAHNNCSGKHAGFLTIARHLGAPTKGYIQPDHPVQRLVMAKVAATAGAKLADAPRGIDGCGIPVFGIALAELAVAIARFAASAETAEARVRAAMAKEPFLVAGSGRFTTKVIEATKGSVLIKEGAEGVYCGAIPARGIGIAVKAEDGAGRAAAAAMGHILRTLGAYESEETLLRNHAGREIGRVAVR
jgi:L-asparaginase II